MARKQIVLRIDEDTLKAIEKWAADDFRSINGQIEWLLSENVKKAKRLIKKSKKDESQTNIKE